MDLVFVDVETTGLDPERHELIEVAAVRVHPHTLEPIDHASARVRPGRLADADPRALEVNGYTDEAWRDAVTLQAALRQVAPLLEGAVVAGHNVGFDWAFLSRGFARAGLPLPAVDYHRVDTASLAWPLLAAAEIDSLSLDAVCGALGLSRPTPHRALADALASLEVARRLRDRSLLGRRVAGAPEPRDSTVFEGIGARARALANDVAELAEYSEELHDLLQRGRTGAQARIAELEQKLAATQRAVDLLQEQPITVPPMEGRADG